MKQALLTPRCGKNAADVLDAGNIKLYKTISDSVKENIDAFMDKKLSVLDDIHAGFHGHGGR
jgi:predicted Fe-Mo cluster-binding NifX family protein